jgi:ADP-ribose pyrophosphatase YjhB (NUDIX family)
MMNFGDFLQNRLLEDASREGQVAQFRKSLTRLSKTKKSLGVNGLDTTDIDNQIDQVNVALNRRLSATHQWHGAIVRVDQEPINNIVMWRFTTSEGIVFHIPVAKSRGIIKVSPYWHQYPSPQKPMNKFIEYREESWGSTTLNLITYAESRTVDVVPFRTSKDRAQYYLIRRRESGLWATVGGHIEEGELANPIGAARRELKEETGATALFMRQLPTGWVRCGSTATDNPESDYHSWTLPYLALINPDFQMTPSDDAVGGEWFDLEDMPGSFQFNRHKDIIHQALELFPQVMKQFGKH